MEPMTTATRPDVRIAERAGFCYGVRLAIDKAKHARSRGQGGHHPRPAGAQPGHQGRSLRSRHPDRRPGRPGRGRHARHPRPRRPEVASSSRSRARRASRSSTPPAPGCCRPEGRPGAGGGRLHGVHHRPRGPSRGQGRSLVCRRQARGRGRHGPIHLGARAAHQEDRRAVPVDDPAARSWRSSPPSACAAPTTCASSTRCARSR